MEPEEFKRRVENSNVLVAHAGMGSILTALQYGKPILVMPRHAARSEARNDHQLATARHLSNHPGIEVAADECELLEKLEGLSRIDLPPRIASTASPELIDRLRRFIMNES